MARTTFSDSTKDQKRAEIILAARKLFKRFGVKKTTMRDIASEAGLAVGTLYLYFKSRDEVVLACAEAFEQVHLEAAKLALESSGSPAERLKMYILGRFRASAETRTSDSHVAEIARAVIRVRPTRLEDESKIMQHTILELFAQGSKDGSFRIADPNRDMMIFLYSIAWFFPIEKSEFLPEPEESVLAKLIDWFIEKWSAA
ncbi:MAG: TetR/AcrR family transcriptional regulator [Candidatus Melainabacteria bacterium]|nr:MAG: TetR/AcrR family transcriptional regulator [Candidatus Melainabacteria bacterium]